MQYLGNHESAAVGVVRAQIPVNTPYQVVRHGQDNLIVLAAGAVYRFPRSEAVWNRAERERIVLETLREHPEIPVPILKHVHENPAYTVSVALDGLVLENHDLWEKSTFQQYEIGKQIGTFAATFHALFRPAHLRPWLIEKSPQKWYNTYIEHTLRLPGPYADLATWVVAEWPMHDHSESTVIHDDLHTHNMLFDEAGTLVGVLDFGDVNLGNPEQDLRYTYWMGDGVIDGAIDAYEQHTGKTLDRTLIELCAISQELSGLYDKKRAYMHDRARKNLSYRKLI